MSTAMEKKQIYDLVKNPTTKLWEDQSGQTIRKNYKIDKLIECPCKQYLNEFCDKNFSTKHDGFHTHVSFIKHTQSKIHKSWIEHKNNCTSILLNKSNNELIEQIEELEREKRKDKVDFRKYLEMIQNNKDKEIELLSKEIELLSEKNKSNKLLIETKMVMITSLKKTISNFESKISNLESKILIDMESNN